MIKTYTGINFNIDSPRIEDIVIEDIAESLSKQCRFNGHCKGFYSVAQHSILVSDKCTNKLWGLLHDAAETYIGDIITPIKRECGEFINNLEAKILKLIAQKFNLSWPIPQEVKIADMRMYDTEARDLMGEVGGQPYPEVIFPNLDCMFFRDVFLNHFRKLYETV